MFFWASHVGLLRCIDHVDLWNGSLCSVMVGFGKAASFIPGWFANLRVKIIIAILFDFERFGDQATGFQRFTDGYGFVPMNVHHGSGVGQNNKLIQERSKRSAIYAGLWMIFDFLAVPGYFLIPS